MSAPASLPRIHLVRHGETEWSLGGRHTSRTDIPLTPRGEEQARRLGVRLKKIKFLQVFTSPSARARRTCEFAGLAASARIETELREWDYGDYEGRTSADIHASHAGWNLFIDGAPHGESPDEVFARAQDFARRLRAMEGDIAVFSHGHFLRVLAVAWVGFPVGAAQHLEVDPASHSLLGYEHGRRENAAIALWNEIDTADPVVN